MKGLMWRVIAAVLVSCAFAGSVYGQVLRLGAVGASSGIAKGMKYGMRSLTGQAAAGIPVNDSYRQGVGFWFADTQIMIPDAAEGTDALPDGIPARFELRQNYPNPFNPSTTIEYDMPVLSHVTVEVFNILGQRVTVLVDEIQSAGRHKVVWNATYQGGSPAASGVYIYRIAADHFVKTRTMTLVK